MNDKNKETQTFDKVSEVNLDLDELAIKQSVENMITWYIDGIASSVDDISLKIWNHRQINGKKQIQRSDIANVLYEKNNEVSRNLMNKFKSDVAYSDTAKDTFDDVCKLMFGVGYDEHCPIILKHVMWTVKRRVFGMTDYCPIFLSIYGAAGKGKSECLNALFSVLPPNKIDICKFSKGIFEDERHAYRFVENYIVIMDEICGLGKTDINNIKNQIDSKKMNYRLLGFHKSAEGRNNAQLIGTSNTRLRNTIQSDTDIRKWAELDIVEWPDDEVSSKLVEPMKQFDWHNLWKSVNENGDSPFHNSTIYSNFKSWTSSKCRHESPTALFIDDALTKYQGQFLTKTTLYDEDYLLQVEEYPLSWANFKEKCEKYGCIWKRKNTGYGLLFPDSNVKFIEENETLNRDFICSQSL